MLVVFALAQIASCSDKSSTVTGTTCSGTMMAPDQTSSMVSSASSGVLRFAYAETNTPDLTPAGNIADDHTLVLDRGYIWTFEADGHIYAAVTSLNGVQLLDITDPHDIVPTDSITDNHQLALDDADNIVTFEADGRTYAAVASFGDSGMQMLDVTDPYDIVPADSITDDNNLALYGARGIDTFKVDGSIYAAVASFWDTSIQLFDVTDPYDIVPADSAHVGAFAHSITIFQSDGHAYAVVASNYGGGIHIPGTRGPLSPQDAFPSKVHRFLIQSKTQ